MNSVEVTGLGKTFHAFRRRTEALRDVSLTVAPGTIFGLLGRNGAGKTTLVKILMGMTQATSGQARLLGEPVSARVRRRVGYLPEQMRLPDYMKAESFLRFMGRLNHVSDSDLDKKIPTLLELVELGDARKKLLKEYSKGMGQRLGLAQSLINDPDLLFLDEPTEGLDPLGRKQVRELLLTLRAAGKTIFLNSHLLSEIELVCDQVAIIDKGRVVRTGHPEEFTRSTGVYRIKLARLDENVRRAAAAVAVDLRCDDASVEFVPTDRRHLNAMIDALRSAQVEIESVEAVRSSLEESFIQVVTHSGEKVAAVGAP
jgi:ABC-2 type transport system ATP-binding protein